VLAVGLREHHQLHIGGVAIQSCEGFDQVVDFVIGQGQAPGLVGLFQRSATATQDIHMVHGRRVQRREQSGSITSAGHGRLGHAVVQHSGHLAQLLCSQFGCAEQARFQGQAVFGQALHAAHIKTAVVGDVGRLGRPGRDGADAGADHDDGAIAGACVRLTIGQQRRQGVFLGVLQRCCGGHQMHETGVDALNVWRNFCQTWQKLGNAKVAEGAGAFESRDVQGHGVAL
jgi:hypothetical protein